MSSNILVPVDLDVAGSWEQALSTAAGFAKAQGANLHLLSVIPAGPAVLSQYVPGGYEELVSGKVAAELDKLKAGLDVESGKVTTSVRFGGVYQEILAYADKVGADLIVIGSHKPGVADYLLGSNASRVVRHAPCSVFVVR